MSGRHCVQHNLPHPVCIADENRHAKRVDDWVRRISDGAARINGSQPYPVPWIRGSRELG